MGEHRAGVRSAHRRCSALPKRSCAGSRRSSASPPTRCGHICFLPGEREATCCSRVLVRRPRAAGDDELSGWDMDVRWRCATRWRRRGTDARRRDRRGARCRGRAAADPSRCRVAGAVRRRIALPVQRRRAGAVAVGRGRDRRRRAADANPKCVRCWHHRGTSVPMRGIPLLLCAAYPISKAGRRPAFWFWPDRSTERTMDPAFAGMMSKEMTPSPKPNALPWLALSALVIVLDQWSKH